MPYTSQEKKLLLVLFNVVEDVENPRANELDYVEIGISRVTKKFNKSKECFVRSKNNITCNLMPVSIQQYK